MTNIYDLWQVWSTFSLSQVYEVVTPFYKWRNRLEIKQIVQLLGSLKTRNINYLIVKNHILSHKCLMRASDLQISEGYKTPGPNTEIRS